MKQNLENDEVEYYYYYDSHPTKEDLMGEASVHRALSGYLALVLEWMFRGQHCAIYENLNFYFTADSNEVPLVPDVAVIKGVDSQDLRSWKIGTTGPAPQVVFEIASRETWRNDIVDKPGQYGLVGVKEYFYYDPDESPRWRRRHRRLIGWQWNKASGQLMEMATDKQGGLWSQHLESFLVPDGKWVRLYDTNLQRRLTEAEAEAQANKALLEKTVVLAQEKEELAFKAKALAEKLRSLGINPDEL